MPCDVRALNGWKPGLRLVSAVRDLSLVLCAKRSGETSFALPSRRPTGRRMRPGGAGQPEPELQAGLAGQKGGTLPGRPFSHVPG